MSKLVMYLRYSYQTFIWVFALTTLPFTMLRLASFELKELPFMFLALLGLIKFYLASYQTSKVLERKISALNKGSNSKQKMVQQIQQYKGAQDAALLINGIIILILNIFL